MSRPCETGGRIEGQGFVPEDSLGFGRVVMAILRVVARCDRAKKSVQDKVSVDDDFWSNEEMAKKIMELDESYRASRESLVKMMLAHQGIRGIHQTRQEMERRAQNLREDEAKFL